MTSVSFAELPPEMSSLQPPPGVDFDSLTLEVNRLGRAAARRGLGSVGLSDVDSEGIPSDSFFLGLDDAYRRLWSRAIRKRWAGWAVVEPSQGMLGCKPYALLIIDQLEVKDRAER